jgi:hypothetical protein
MFAITIAVAVMNPTLAIDVWFDINFEVKKAVQSNKKKMRENKKSLLKIKI